MSEKNKSIKKILAFLLIFILGGICNETIEPGTFEKVVIKVGYLSGISKVLYKWKYSEQLHGADTMRYDRLQVKIDKNAWDGILAQREFAKRAGGWFYKNKPEFPGWQKGKIILNEKDTFKIKVRIKGGPPHYKFLDRISLKIKMRNGKSILGLRKFALQHPSIRGYLNEWYLHKMLAYWGLINLKYEFVELKVNGGESMTFAMEENMDNVLIKRNEYQQSAIFKIRQPGKLDLPIDFYNLKDAKDDSLKTIEFAKAKSMLSNFMKGKTMVSETFNLDAMARYYALIDLTGHHHATHPYNMKFYFNPENQLIEPIGYDNSSTRNLEEEGLLGFEKVISKEVVRRQLVDYKNTRWYELVFRDGLFYEKYIEYLLLMSNPEWLDDFFSKTEKESKRNFTLIRKSLPNYTPEYVLYQQSILYDNQDYIKDTLMKMPMIKIKSIGDSNNACQIIVDYRGSLPLKIEKIVYNGEVEQRVRETYIQSKSSFEFPRDQVVAVDKPEGLKIELITIYCGVPGSGNINKVNYNVIKQNRLD